MPVVSPPTRRSPSRRTGGRRDAGAPAPRPCRDRTPQRGRTARPARRSATVTAPSPPPIDSITAPNAAVSAATSIATICIAPVCQRPVRLRPHPVRSEVRAAELLQPQRMGNWNFADIWEIGRRRAARRPCARSTVIDASRGASSTGGPTASARTCSTPGSSASRRWPSTSTTAPSTWSRCSPRSRRRSSRSTPTTATPPTSCCTCGTTPTPGAVVFHGSFADTIEPIRERLPKVQRLAVGRRRFRLRAPTGRRRTRPPRPRRAAASSPEWGRTGDDLDMLYTGGTTGMPKGVMWRQDDLAVDLTATLGNPLAEDGTVDDLRGDVHRARRPPFLPACPQMHGTGNFPCLSALSGGGCDRHAHQTAPSTRSSCSTPSSARASDLMAIVGDAFGKPILRTLDAEPGPLGPVQPGGDRLVGRHVEQGDQGGPARPPPRHAADRRLLLVRGARHGLVDLGRRRRRPRPPSSSSARTRSSSTSRTDRSSPARARSAGWRSAGASPSATTRTRRSRPARSSRSTDSATPAPATSPRSRPTARSRSSGAARCASTPAARRSSPRRSRRRSSAIRRCSTRSSSACPTRSSARRSPASSSPDRVRRSTRPSLIAHVRGTLAAYKSPKRIVVVDTIGRAPNGKVDYKRLKAEATDRLGAA